MQIGKSIHEIQIGDKVSFTRTFTQADVVLFVGVTWDTNPYHTNEAFAKRSRFGDMIVPGLLAGSMLTHVGGAYAMLASNISFTFMAPVFIGDTITCEVEVVEKEQKKNWMKLRMRCFNQGGKEVLIGEASGFLSEKAAEGDE